MFEHTVLERLGGRPRDMVVAAGQSYRSTLDNGP
jgi:hypothetical protein